MSHNRKDSNIRKSKDFTNAQPKKSNKVETSRPDHSISRNDVTLAELIQSDNDPVNIKTDFQTPTIDDHHTTSMMTRDVYANGNLNDRRSVMSNSNLYNGQYNPTQYTTTYQGLQGSPTKPSSPDKRIRTTSVDEDQLQTAYSQRNNQKIQRSCIDRLLCRQTKTEKITQTLEELSLNLSDQLKATERALENWKTVRKNLRKIVALRILLNLEYHEQNEKVQSSKYVMHPESSYKFMYELIVNIAYIASFFLTPFVIAFLLDPHDYTRWIEFAIDIILTLDIIKQFFTGYNIEDDQVEMRLKIVAWRYFTGDFIFDALGTLPGLVTGESVKQIYYFKLVRYAQIKRLFAQLNDLLERIQKVLVHNQAVENFFVVLRTLLYLFVLFHVLACFWILLSYTENSWINSSYILNQSDRESYLFVYVTSLYFVTTTATTVGYGDFSALNSWEKIYLLFLEFTGICTFSVITGNITGLKHQKKIADIIEDKQAEIESFLFEIDKSTSKNLDGETYDQAKEYIGICYLEGIQAQMKEGGYFELLPPKLKDKLVFTALKKYYQKFYYFFNDVSSQNFAPNTFVGKILVNLDCQIYQPGVEVIQARQEVDRLYFVYKGAVGIRPETLFESLQLPGDFGEDIRKSRAKSMSHESPPLGFHQQHLDSQGSEKDLIECIAILPEGSFFGDYQILFNIASNYDFYTMNVGDTWLMSISAEQFLESCDDFPGYHQFISQRALLRRNHFRELEAQSNEALKRRPREDQIRTTLDKHHSNSLAQQLNDITQFDDEGVDNSVSQAIQKNHLMNQDLIKLADTEMPVFKADKQTIDINFTLPILRMYLQSVDDISMSNNKYLTSKFKKFKDFFKIVDGVERDVELKTIQEELEIYNFMLSKDKKNQAKKETIKNMPKVEWNNTFDPKQSQKMNKLGDSQKNPLELSQNISVKPKNSRPKIDEDILNLEQELNTRIN
eukprot:403373987